MNANERRTHRLTHTTVHPTPGCGMCAPKVHWPTPTDSTKCLVGQHHIMGTWIVTDRGRVCTHHYLG